MQKESNTMDEKSNAFGSMTNGMGDIIMLNSVFKYLRGQYVVQLPKCKEKYKIFFDGIAEVEITDSPQCLQDLGYGHYSTRKLRNFFGDHADFLDIRPTIMYSDMESEQWAAETLKDIKNPVIFVPTCAIGWKELRSIPVELALGLLEHLKESGLTPIVCQASEYKYDIKNHICIEDLDIKKYVCLMRRVGFYIGANTGDMHLAVGVGAKTVVYQPRASELFSPVGWCYVHPSVTYVEF